MLKCCSTIGHLLTDIIINDRVLSIYLAAAFFGRSTKYAMTSPATAYVALAHCKYSDQVRNGVSTKQKKNKISYK